MLTFSKHLPITAFLVVAFCTPSLARAQDNAEQAPSEDTAPPLPGDDARAKDPPAAPADAGDAGTEAPSEIPSEADDVAESPSRSAEADDTPAEGDIHETKPHAESPGSDTPDSDSPSEEVSLSEIEAALQSDAQERGQEQTSGPATESIDALATSAGGGSSSANPDISVIADVAAAYFSDDAHLQTGGHDPTQTGFNLQQLELAIGGSVDPYFRFNANLVFSEFGVEIEEAYATTLALPGRLQARFGQFLTRFGRFNPTHPHSWDFADQPFAIGRIFGGENNRGLGIEVSWLTPLPWYVELVASSTMADGAGTNRSFYGADDLGVEGPEDLLYVTAIKQFFPLSQNWSLNWGLSGALGPNATGRDNRTDVFGTDIYLKYRPITQQSFTIVSLQTEWLYRRRQIPSHVLQDVSSYTQLFWRFAQRWGAAGRYEYGSPPWDSDFNSFPADPLDPEWDAARHRLSANITYWPSEFSRFRLQGSRDLPGWRDGVWALFLAAELSLGAHGTHAF